MADKTNEHIERVLPPEDHDPNDFSVLPRVERIPGRFSVLPPEDHDPNDFSVLPRTEHRRVRNKQRRTQ